MNQCIQEIAEKLYDSCCLRSGERATVFVESTSQLEKCRYRNQSRSRGALWRFGANLSVEHADGKKSTVVYDSEKLSSLVGAACVEKLREQAIDRMPLGPANRIPTVRETETHDVFFSRTIAVASTGKETVCSRQCGRRCELDMFRGRAEITRRWFSKSGCLDFDSLFASAQQSLDVLARCETVGAKCCPVLFHGATAALLFHELIGHPLEADNYAASKKWLEAVDVLRINRQLEFYDDPTLSGGYGSYQFDDLGSVAESHPLLVDGRFYVLGKSDEALTSQRRQDYRFSTLTRASNAVVKRGNERIEDLSSFRDGGLLHVYAVGAGRINNQNGEFEYSVPEAVWVERTGKEHVLADVLLKGKVSELLEKIEGIADDVQELNVTCGKRGQFIPMGAQGPSVRFGATNWTC